MLGPSRFGTTGNKSAGAANIRVTTAVSKGEPEMNMDYDTTDGIDFDDIFGEDFELPAGTTPEQWKLWLEMIADEEVEPANAPQLNVRIPAAPSLEIRDWLAPIEENVSWCA